MVNPAGVSRMGRAILMVEGGMSKNAASKAAGVSRRDLQRAWIKHEQSMGYQRCPCCESRVLNFELAEAVIRRLWEIRETGR